MLSLFWVALLTFGAVFGTNPGKRCGNDVVFVLDESTSIPSSDFTKQLEFVQSVIDSVDIGFDRTHIGVLTYATFERIRFQLRSYYDREELKKAIKDINQTTGDTHTHLALNRTCKDMFNREYSRPLVRHLAIVITDGNSQKSQETKREAEVCRQKNIEMIAIGVGRAIRQEELNAIASSTENVFMVDDYNALERLREKLADKACEPPPAPIISTTQSQRNEACRKKIDHVWAISEYAGVIETKYALNFIKKVTNEIKIDPLFVQVGLAPRLCHERDEIRLKDHDTKEWFWRDLDRYQLTGLYTDQTIEYLRLKGITAENGARSDADKFGILIVDFEAENWKKSQREALRAKNEGIRLIVIGVGYNIREDQLRQLAWSNEDYFYAKSYSQLDDLESALFQRLCGGISTAKPRAWQPWRRFFEDFYSE